MEGIALMSVSKKATMFALLNGQRLEYAIKLHQMKYPILMNYVSQSGLETIQFLQETFGSKKKVLQYISAFENTSDKSSFERYLKNKNFRNLIILLGFNRMIELLRILSDRKISIHNYISNLGKIKLDDDPEDVFQFLKKITRDYSESNLNVVTNYLNYKKVRHAKNIEEMMKHIEFVEASKRLKGIVGSKEHPSFMHLNDLNFENRDIINFTKSKEVISTIGRETFCCFRRGGAAEALMIPAQKSPIAGILEGRIENNRWFSLVWEMVEIENGEFRKTLILDNIEASGRISNGKILWDALKNLGKYSHIYCGSLRNDIEFEQEVIDKGTKPKQSQLVGYESNFNRYGAYDDSRNLYTIHENTPDLNVKLRRMNLGDLHRVKYIEKFMYGTKADPDFLKINISESPNYILDSNTHIYGYLATRLKFYKSDIEEYEQGKDLSRKELREIIKKNEEDGKEKYHGITKVLYIEDLVILPYRKCILALNDIISDITEWAKKEEIDVVAANTNEYSRGFIKRIKKAGFEYYEQKDIGSFESNRIRTVRSDLEPVSVTSFLKEENPTTMS